MQKKGNDILKRYDRIDRYLREFLYRARLVYHLKACVLRSRITIDGVASKSQLFHLWVEHEIRSKFSIMIVCHYADLVSVQFSFCCAEIAS